MAAKKFVIKTKGSVSMFEPNPTAVIDIKGERTK